MLSLRLLLEHLVEQARKVVLQIARTKSRNIERIKQGKLTEEPSSSVGGSIGVSHYKALRKHSFTTSQGGGIYKFLQPITARLVETLVRKVPTPLWNEARRRAARSVFGETAPFFALVGVTLVAGPERGLLTAHDELEALCGDIREAISRAGWIHNPAFWSSSDKGRDNDQLTKTSDVHYSLENFIIGSVLDKGCNAVVYAAKWKQDKDELPVASIANENTRTCDNEPYCTLGDKISIAEFPLALKMMFNYEVESNAPSILTAMYKELIPARAINLDENLSLWKQKFLSGQRSLPPHANVVEMPCVFVDLVPSLQEGRDLYPDALPRRLNPSGFGRNMSLFCVMKRYHCTLADYLTHYEVSSRTSLLLLTQLLEAVCHINKYGIVHRDLKGNNILLSLADGTDSPILALSDFGCCLSSSNLSAPFPSYEVDPRQGNTAFMSPEVKCATPGLLSSVNYSRADIWAVGCVAYEIFGLENPFTPGKSSSLDSYSYKEAQLPKLPKTVMPALRYLISDMLRRNPRQRPSSEVAATVCQLALWGPSKWLTRHALTLPSDSEVARWLLCLSTKVICEAGMLPLVDGESFPGTSGTSGENSFPVRDGKMRSGGRLEYEVVSTFLSRVHYNDIIQAIKWVRVF